MKYTPLRWVRCHDIHTEFHKDWFDENQKVKMAVAAENWFESLRVPKSIDEKIEESKELVWGLAVQL
jgi:hypothetical protein